MLPSAPFLLLIVSASPRALLLPVCGAEPARLLCLVQAVGQQLALGIRCISTQKCPEVFICHLLPATHCQVRCSEAMVLADLPLASQAQSTHHWLCQHHQTASAPSDAPGLHPGQNCSSQVHQKSQTMSSCKDSN